MIRKAKIADVMGIAKLMHQAMGDLAHQFSASDNDEEAINLLTHFISLPQNQYSFNHILVYELEGKIVGEINAYDGDQIEKLRKPFFDYLTTNYHPDGFSMEMESKGGEFYIDTISVDPHYQGKGIGKELLIAAIKWGQELGHYKIGLLVNSDNPSAKKLYERLGFSKQDEVVLLGNMHEHLTQTKLRAS